MPGATSSALIVLQGLEGNAPTALTTLQTVLYPYVPLLERMWWIAWIGILAYMTINYIAVPLVAKIHTARNARKN